MRFNKSMRAAQINAYGGKAVLKTVNDAPKPEPGKGQVLVEVWGAAVNPFDLTMREGKAQAYMPLEFPATLGGDFAGIVAALGEEVSGFSVGQEVYGQAHMSSGHGSYAEFALAKAEAIAPKPHSIDLLSSSALPLTGVSAYQALVEHANLQKGQKVLIHGGAGGIGSLAIQLAKHLGAFVATTAAAGDTEFVKSLGADEIIDYKTQDFAGLLKDYDVVYDTIGGDTFKKSFQVLKPGGIIVSMLGQPAPELEKEYSVREISQASHVTTQHLAKLSELVDQGVIHAQIDKVFPLEQASEALEYIKQGIHHGKIVIKIK